MDQETTKPPTYQQTIGHALAYSSVPAACQMLEVMHHRGTLDILERDDEGYNVIDRFLEWAPLCGPMLDTLDKLGATNSYTQAHKGHFITMDRQVKWTKSLGNDTDQRHASQDSGQKRPEATLARMIGQVDEAWFNVEGHEIGARQVVKLVACPMSAPLALAACWRRGINPNVRRPDSTLAVAAMQQIEVFSQWAKAGGDVHAPVSDRKPYPLWQRWADRADMACSYKDTAGEISETLKDLVDPDSLRDVRQFMSARHHRGNQSEMIKLLNSIPQWMHKRRYTGTPIWLAAVRLRPLLIENLVERKRSRPDFSQRDAHGRSVWFAALSSCKDDVFDRLQKVVPIQAMGRDEQGRGLLVQAIASHGGLSGLGKDNTRYPVMEGCIQQMLRATSDDRGCFLDGMDDFGPEQLDGMDHKIVGRIAVQLIGQPTVACRMRSDTCIRLVDGFLHGSRELGSNIQLTEEQGQTLEACIVDLVARQCDIPIETWLAAADDMKSGYNQQASAMAERLQVILTAQHSSASLQKNTNKGAAAVARVGRF